MRKWLVVFVAIVAGLTASPAYATQTVIKSDVYSSHGFQTETGIVWTTPTTGYAFYTLGTPTSNGRLYYTKTTNGGATWGSGVAVSSAAETANRISNFNVYYGGWNPFDSQTIIHIAWLDALQDSIQYRQLNTATDTLGTDTQVTTLPLFTLDVSFANQHISITRAVGSYLYISARPSNSDSANRFMRSIDNGANWTTRTVGVSTQSAKSFLAPGNETDPNDIYALHAPSGSSTAQVWLYDDSANVWSVQHTVTLANTITASGLNPSAMAIAKDSGHVWFGVRDNTGTSSATFYLIEVTNAADIDNRADVYTAQTDRGEGISLTYDYFNDLLFAHGTNIVSGETRPTQRISSNGGQTWLAAEETIDVADSMLYPHEAPGLTVEGGRIAPVFKSTETALNTLELESELNVAVYGAPETPLISDDPLGGKIDNALSAANLGGDSGKLLFTVATLILLAILLIVVKAPTFVALPMLAVWAGGLALTGFLPGWVVIVAVMIGGLGIVMLISRGSGEES